MSCTNGSLWYIDAAGCPSALPSGEEGDILIVGENGDLCWISLRADNVPLVNQTRFENVETAIQYILNHLGAVSQFSLIAPGVHRHNSGLGTLYTIDTRASALPYDNSASGISATTVQAAIDILANALGVAHPPASVSGPGINIVSSTQVLSLDLSEAGTFDNTQSGASWLPSNIQGAIAALAARRCLTLTKNASTTALVTYTCASNTLNVSPRPAAQRTMPLTAAAVLIPSGIYVHLTGGTTVDYDTYSTSASPMATGANDRLIAPLDGIYAVRGEVSITKAGGYTLSTRLSAGIAVNSVAGSITRAFDPAPLGQANAAPQTIAYVSAQAGDYFSVFAYAEDVASPSAFSVVSWRLSAHMIEEY